MPTIHLQALGQCEAKPAGELKPGDLMSFNYTPREYRVDKIEPAGSTQVKVTLVNIRTGSIYTKRFAKARLVAAITP